jgi:carbonic anhydrase
MDTRSLALLKARPFVGGAAALLVLSFGAAALSAEGNPQFEALARLKAGNARFVVDASEPLPVTAQRRAALAQGQSPFAMVLSCADSRVPPEIVFHTGLGDLFVVRAAGHVPDRSVLASLEYGAEHLHVPLLVVMGHEMCGAVKATLDSVQGASLGPNLDYLIKMIRPAAQRVANQPAEVRLRLAILENVEETINTIIESSATLRHLVETNRLLMVGSYYELSSGRALFSQPVAVPPSRVAPPVSRVAEPQAAGAPRTTAAPVGGTGAQSAGAAGAPAAMHGAGSSTAIKPAASASVSSKPASAPPTGSTKPVTAPASAVKPTTPTAVPGPAASQPATTH